MTAWTPQEIRTLTRNMHFTPSGIRSVIPTRTVEAIRKQKARITKLYPSSKDWRERADIYGSLRLRGWSGMEANLYVSACLGDEKAVEKLTRSGLWNMKCEGVMS